MKKKDLNLEKNKRKKNKNSMQRIEKGYQSLQKSMLKKNQN